MTHQMGIEMAEVIPGFLAHFDIPDLVACFAPRRVLIVSATDDPNSQDADRVVAAAGEVRCIGRCRKHRTQTVRRRPRPDAGTV